MAPRRPLPRSGVLVGWCAALAAACISLPAAAEEANRAEAEFDAGFLHGTSGMSVDVSRFERGNPVLPGTYIVDLVVNDMFVERTNVRFVSGAGSNEAQPCFDRTLLARAGLALSALPKSTREHIASQPQGACIDLASISPAIHTAFDQSRLQLTLTVPQTLVAKTPRGYVSPEFWEKGVPSATLRYDLSFFHADTSTSISNSAYLRIDAGANLGSWHMRQRFSLSFGEDGTRYDNVATYLVHDLPDLESRLIVGDAFTDGTVFDSIGLRGVSLATDDRMRPESQSGYAPTVRGIARTNARVRVSQNGVLLLETTVPPGPFEINDLYATGYGGDLDVAILEADGAQSSFRVPYAALPQMLRPGVLRYEVAGGEYRDGTVGTGEAFAQATAQYGLSNRLTGYAGAQLASGYSAGLIGMAWNTPLGAMATDVTYAAITTPDGLRTNGYSVRASLAKTIAPTDTTLSFAAYRYSSSGFWSLQDALRLRARRAVLSRQRERMQVNLSQTLPGRWGSLYLSGSTSRYWDRPGNVVQLQAGYNNAARLFDTRVNYGLAYSRLRDETTGQTDSRLLLSVSAALGNKPYSPQLTASIARVDTVGDTEANGQIAVTGTLRSNPRLSYSLVAIAMPDADSLSVGLGYRGKRTTLSGTASVGTGYKQASFGMSGGVVVHPGGITLTNQLEDTVAIVSAPGARGARVRSGDGIEIDGRGNAVVPYLRPYRVNDVSIDPEGLPADVELSATSQQVTPRADSVVMVKFDTVRGRAVLFEVHLPDGRPVPFGASVLDDHGNEVAMVGQEGQIFLRLAVDRGALTVKWGDDSTGLCRFGFALPPANSRAAPVLQSEQPCQTGTPETAP